MRTHTDPSTSAPVPSSLPAVPPVPAALRPKTTRKKKTTLEASAPASAATSLEASSCAPTAAPALEEGAAEALRLRIISEGHAFMAAVGLGTTPAAPSCKPESAPAYPVESALEVMPEHLAARVRSLAAVTGEDADALAGELLDQAALAVAILEAEAQSVPEPTAAPSVELEAQSAPALEVITTPTPASAPKVRRRTRTTPAAVRVGWRRLDPLRLALHLQDGLSYDRREGEFCGLFAGHPPHAGVAYVEGAGLALVVVGRRLDADRCQSALRKHYPQHLTGISGPDEEQERGYLTLTFKGSEADARGLHALLVSVARGGDPQPGPGGDGGEDGHEKDAGGSEAAAPAAALPRPLSPADVLTVEDLRRYRARSHEAARNARTAPAHWPLDLHTLNEARAGAWACLAELLHRAGYVDRAEAAEHQALRFKLASRNVPTINVLGDDNQPTWQRPAEPAPEKDRSLSDWRALAHKAHLAVRVQEIAGWDASVARKTWRMCLAGQWRAVASLHNARGDRARAIRAADRAAALDPESAILAELAVSGLKEERDRDLVFCYGNPPDEGDAGEGGGDEGDGGQEEPEHPEPSDGPAAPVESDRDRDRERRQTPGGPDAGDVEPTRGGGDRSTPFYPQIAKQASALADDDEGEVNPQPEHADRWEEEPTRPGGEDDDDDGNDDGPAIVVSYVPGDEGDDRAEVHENDAHRGEVQDHGHNPALLLRLACLEAVAMTCGGSTVATHARPVLLPRTTTPTRRTARRAARRVDLGAWRRRGRRSR